MFDGEFNALTQQINWANLNGFYAAKKVGNEIRTTLSIDAETLIGNVLLILIETNGKSTSERKFWRRAFCGDAVVNIQIKVMENEVSQMAEIG